MDKINFDKLLKQFAEENVRQDTVKLMIDQLIKKGHCSTSAHEIIGFCILRMLDESAFGIKFTPEQNDKYLQSNRCCKLMINSTTLVLEIIARFITYFTL
jgi:hypothetical protein